MRKIRLLFVVYLSLCVLTAAYGAALAFPHATGTRAAASAEAMDCHARQAASTAHAHAAGQQAAQPALDAAAAVGQEAAPSCCAPVIAFFEPPALLAPRAPQTAWPLSAFSRKPSFLTDGIYRPPRKRA